MRFTHWRIIFPLRNTRGGTVTAATQRVDMSLAPSRLQVVSRHLCSSQKITAQDMSQGTVSSNPITSHVLNTATGKPASNMKISLHKLQEGAWQEVATKITNDDGRAGQFLSQGAFTKGMYRMFFDTGAYFEQLTVKCFYPYVEIVFVIEKPEDHYHIPLLISPYGYTTYRGS